MHFYDEKKNVRRLHLMKGNAPRFSHVLMTPPTTAGTSQFLSVGEPQTKGKCGTAMC